MVTRLIPRGFLDSRRVVSSAVLQKNPRPFDLTHGSNTRSLQNFKSFLFLRGEDQSGEFGFSSHAPNGSMSKRFCKRFNETMY